MGHVHLPLAPGQRLRHSYEVSFTYVMLTQITQFIVQNQRFIF